VTVMMFQHVGKCSAIFSRFRQPENASDFSGKCRFNTPPVSSVRDNFSDKRSESGS
jgi:hypothetical protein